MVYAAQGGCEWRSERVSEHNLNEKVRTGEGSFDGNPHWECVCACAHGSSRATTVLFLAVLVEV